MNKLDKYTNQDKLLSYLKSKHKWCNCGTEGSKVYFIDSNATNWNKSNIKLVCDKCYFNELKKEKEIEHKETHYEQPEIEKQESKGYVSIAKEPRQPHKPLIHTTQKDNLGIAGLIKGETGQNIEVGDEVLNENDIVTTGEPGNRRVKGIKSRLD